jgi:hypothetical protein
VGLPPWPLELKALELAGFDLKLTAFTMRTWPAPLRILSSGGPPTDPRAEWQGMPGYENGDERSFRKIVVHFKNQGGGRLRPADEADHHPQGPVHLVSCRQAPGPRGQALCREEARQVSRTQPQFPIYIVSKGRHDTRLTARALDRLAVPFKIVVEAKSATPMPR